MGNCLTLGVGNYLIAPLGNYLTLEGLRLGNCLIADTLEPGSKLAATRWAAERVAIPGCPAFSDDAAYRAMDFLLAALPEIAEGVFASTASLLNLACDVIFVDTSSTYFEMDAADEEVELETTLAEAEARAAAAAALRGAGRPAGGGPAALQQALQGQACRPPPGGDRHGRHRARASPCAAGPSPATPPTSSSSAPSTTTSRAGS